MPQMFARVLYTPAGARPDFAAGRAKAALLVADAPVGALDSSTTEPDQGETMHDFKLNIEEAEVLLDLIELVEDEHKSEEELRTLQSLHDRLHDLLTATYAERAWEANTEDTNR